MRACRVTGPLAQGQRAQAAAGSYFLGHYATAISLRKAWNLGLRVTSLPAGGAGSGGARGEQYNAAAGSAGPAGGRGGRAGRFGPSPFPEHSLGYTWAPGLGRVKFSCAFWNILVNWQN